MLEIVHNEELLLFFPDIVDSLVIRDPGLGELGTELLDDQLIGVELVPVCLVGHAEEIPLFRGGILEKCLNLDVKLGLIKLGLRKPRQMEF